MVDSPTVVEPQRGHEGAFSVNLSAEKASTLDADLVVFYAEQDAGAKEITGNALLGQIPALQKKQYVASADNAVALSMSLPSPLSVQHGRRRVPAQDRLGTERHARVVTTATTLDRRRGAAGTTSALGARLVAAGCRCGSPSRAGWCSSPRWPRLSVFVGVQDLAPGAVLDALRGAPVDGETAAVVSARVDRTVIALVVGASVALSGVVLQGLTRNPIAEPGILGLNSGAALAVVLGIRFLGLTTVTGYAVAALVGTVLVAVLVQSLTMMAPRSSATGRRWRSRARP